MKTSSKLLFFMMMTMSTLMIMSSSNWMNLWIGLEINMMSFIPLMFKPKNNFLSQSGMMYFLIQSMSSIIFLITMLISMYFILNLNKNMLIKLMIMMSMMMKMGMPPFHMWFPEIMSKLKWNMCMLLMTWQKIAPMYIISQMLMNNKITMMIIIISTMMGSIMGLNHTSTRKIMAYSSMNHLGWMTACAVMYKKLWIMYMMLYSMMIIIMCINLNKYNIMFINQFNIKSLTMMEKLSFMIMMLSMGGMPPFMGFLPKWITIEYMMMSKEMFIMIMMTMSSLITLSFYMKMISSISLMMNFSQKWMNLNKNKKNSTTSMLYINMTLPMLMMLMNFM
uniref:NADH-ubiquinone oxidoreductase chain 2 n=1 Tax=Onomaus tenuis TaxID=2813422 RepID=A0A8T9ZY21_9HEMI|nr:NADH dehydrogenase subunit 2 [Onomaus tenuis]